MLCCAPTVYANASEQKTALVDEEETLEYDSNRIYVSGTTGWVIENNHWCYYINGVKQTGSLYTQEGEYLLDSNGYMITGWYRKDANAPYVYYDPQKGGVRAYGLTPVNGVTYYFYGYMRTDYAVVENGVFYYFGEDGALANQMNGVSDGWLSIGSDWYYVENGVLFGGLKTIGGATYYFDQGKMVTNARRMVHDSSSNMDKWYEFDANGHMIVGWSLDSDGIWYYYNSDGASASGMKTIGAATYYFAADGRMCTNYSVSIGEVMYYFGNDGVLSNTQSKPSDGCSRNGYKPKTLRSNYGSVDIRVPQDRNSDYEPRIVPKYSRDISEIDEKIIRMYARGMSTRQISDQIMDIYGFEVSEALVTDVTNKILPEIESWQKRPLCAVYPIVYIDAIVFNVRDNGIIRKQAAYVILGISEEGHKEVLSITIGESESAKFWLSVLNELKNRGVKDIFVLCADGLTGIGDAIAAAFPMTEYQRCIVHMVRNTLKYVADKDRKEFANDLKTIYHAPDEEQGYRNMQVVAEKWDKKYPRSMDRWKDNWAAVSPMFKFSDIVRRVIYTTNAIESLNSGFRRLNRSRNVFPDSKALLKALYLAADNITKKWTNTLRDWGTGLC